jgi:ABC-type sugar transport system ATPase subunit
MVATAPIGDLTRGAIIRMMVGREESEFYQRTPHRRGRELLRLEGASLSGSGTGRRWLLEDIGLTVHAGEVLGIAGLLGAGRTELLEGIFGAYGDRFRGRLFLEGRPVVIASPADACRAGLALVTEDRNRLGIFPNFDVGRNVSISCLERFRRGFLLRSRLEDRAVGEAIARWNVRTPGPRVPITALSGGNQQKAILARWMQTEPRVVFLDEPTRGIDVGAKVEIYRRIDELAGEGLGVVVVSSELPELLALADRVLVLCEGRLTAELAGEEARPERVMAAAAPGGEEG